MEAKTELQDEIIDKIYAMGSKEDGIYKLDFKQLHEAAEEIEKVTIDVAIKFAEWVDVNAVRSGFHLWTVGCGPNTKRFTSDQLFKHWVTEVNKL